MDTPKIIDESQIALIESRLDQTSTGPWTPMIEGRDHTSGSSCIRTQVGGIDLDGATNADIEFMAHAHQDVRYLISEIRRLAALLQCKT